VKLISVRRALRAFRRRDRLGLDLRPARAWKVDVRIERRNLKRVLDALSEIERFDSKPPAAGPEAEVTITVLAISEPVAERVARRLFERNGVHVLAACARNPAVLR
jgi:hypothetical protein